MPETTKHCAWSIWKLHFVIGCECSVQILVGQLPEIGVQNLVNLGAQQSKISKTGDSEGTILQQSFHHSRDDAMTDCSWHIQT